MFRFLDLQGAQHFTNMIYRYANERKKNKNQLKTAKKEATKVKKELSDFNFADDKKARLAFEAKDDYEKQL